MSRGPISLDRIRELIVEFAESHEIEPALVDQWIDGRGGLSPVHLDPAKCGTDGNYRAHRRRGEYPCQACVKAHTAAGARSRRSKRENEEKEAAA